MRIVRLTQEHTFKLFDCGEDDLNDFLLQDAKQYAKGLLAVSFYESNGFKPLRKINEGDTVPMYYDLTQLI